MFQLHEVLDCCPCCRTFINQTDAGYKARPRTSQTGPMNADNESNADETDLTPEVMAALGDGRVLEADGELGRSRLEFTCKPEMCHSGGIAQGGFVTGWIDSAMAHACVARYTTAYWIATLEIKVSFFKPATPGIVIAEGWIERAGKQTVFTEGRLLDTDGAVLAKGTSTIRLVPNRSD
jgi:acyl-CoA thioesterase